MLAGGAARVQAKGLAHISPGRQPWVYGWFLSLQANGLPHSIAPSSVPKTLHLGFRTSIQRPGVYGLVSSRLQRS